MNVLFVSSYYPPYAPMSGTRIAKMTRYFHERGHGVRVLTAENPAHPPVLSPGIPEALIRYVKLDHKPSLLARLRGLFRRPAPDGGEDGGGEVAASAEVREGGIKAVLRRWYYQLAYIPDTYKAWQRPAVEAGLAVIREFRPDVIYASLPLHSAFLVAAELARVSEIPLVVEYRDLWVEHPYYDEPFWRRLIERRMEHRAARQVSAYVTVTEGWAGLLRRKRGKRTELALNGFDPNDFATIMPRRFADQQYLTVFYAGALYGDKRDPSPLFEALRRMGEEAKAVRVLFHTPVEGELAPRIKEYGLEGIVESKGPLPQRDVLALEAGADLLLLLRWDHPSEESVLAGKLFEYIGAGRPILSVGLETGEAADLIRDNGFGLVSKDPDDIAAQLREWIGEHARGGLPPLDSQRQQQFGRDSQFAKVESLLEAVVSQDV